MPSRITFGTDGWRAIIAEDYTFDNVRTCAQAMAEYQQATGTAARGLVVGYDTRFASERFADAVAEVLAANGIRVYLSDRAQPTPVASYAILARQAGGAVVITASHNPALYNGFKVKPEYAGSAPPEVVQELERRIEAIQARPNGVKRLPLAEAERQGLVERFDATPDYVAQVERLVDLPALRAAGITIVADAMYGAGSGYFARLLSGGATRVIGIRQERNPAFPGINPEPITPNLALLFDTVRQSGAAAGLATDGDADRIGLVDEQGRFINQHQVFGLLLLYLLQVRGMRGDAVRSVTMTSMGDRFAEAHGFRVHETPVGFKYIGPRMTAVDAILGGEESGGFGFAGHIPERDAIVSGLFLLDLMVKLGKSMSQTLAYLQEQMGAWYYDRVDIQFPAQEREAITARVQSAQPKEIGSSPLARVNTIDGYKFIAEDGSWLLIRFSGTEPLLRIYTETTSPERVQRILEQGRQLAGV